MRRISKFIRYGKTGGTYEATYLDALLRNLSDLHPKRIHADTHGQSAAVFGLAYLLDIELMPRIRSWRKLKLYRSERGEYASRRDPMFSGTVNWSLIREHYDLFMQLALAIQSGANHVLARLDHECFDATGCASVHHENRATP